MTGKDDRKARQASVEQAKGLVKEAIGKLIGDPAVELEGLKESKSGTGPRPKRPRPASDRAGRTGSGDDTQKDDGK